MGMRHNWILVQKADLKPIERCFSDSQPVSVSTLLEWLAIDQDVPPVYDDTIEKLNVSFSKVAGKFKISYTKVLL